MSGQVARYVEDFVKIVGEHLGTGLRDADLAGKLMEDLSVFLKSKSGVVSNAEFREWLEQAGKKAEFRSALGNRAIRRILEEGARTGLSRQGFRVRFDELLRQWAGGGRAIDDAAIDGMMRRYNLAADDPLVRAAKQITERARAGEFPPSFTHAAEEAVHEGEAVGARTTEEAVHEGEAAGRRTTEEAAEDAEAAGRRTTEEAAEDAEAAGRRTTEEAADAGGDGGRRGRRGRTPRGPVTGSPAGADGERVMSKTFESWAHRLARFHYSTIWNSIVGDGLSLGNLKKSLPTFIGIRNRMIRPAIRFVDNVLKESGVMEEVIKLQGDLNSIARNFGSAGGRDALNAEGAKSAIATVFERFAARNGDKLDGALDGVRRMLAELRDGESVVKNKYPGLSGLTQRQAENMERWLTDMESMLVKLKGDGSVQMATEYQAVIDRIATRYGTDLAGRSDELQRVLHSRFARLGSDVKMRADDVLIGMDGQPVLRDGVPVQARTWRINELERRLEGGNYNRYDRTSKILTTDDEHNVELRMYELLHDFEKQAPRAQNVEPKHEFFGKIMKFYDAGLEHDVTRIIRVLKSKMGASARETIPNGLDGVVQEAIEKARSAGDLHRMQFLEDVSSALKFELDTGRRWGPREVERRLVAPFSEFFMMAEAYPMRRGWGNWFTGYSVPTTDNYIRYPIYNAMRESWAYLTGGATKRAAGFREGEFVIDDADKLLKRWDYTWLYRRAPEGHVGSQGLWGAQRSMFGLLGQDGALDRLPWYIKMPGRLMTGGMISARSRVGLTLPGKVLLGGLAATYAIDKGTAALGWNGLDGQPGIQIPWVDPRGPIHYLQSKGMGFYDFWWDTVPRFVSGDRFTGVDLDTGRIGPLPSPNINIREWILSWTDRGPEMRRAYEEMATRAQGFAESIPHAGANITNMAESTRILMEHLRQAAEDARSGGDAEKAHKLEDLYQQLEPDQRTIAAALAQTAALKEQTQEAFEAFRNSQGDVVDAEEALAQLEAINREITQIETVTREKYQSMRTRVGAVPEAAPVLTGVPEAPVISTQPDQGGVRTGADQHDQSGARTGDDQHDQSGARTGADQHDQSGAPVFIGQPGASTTTGTPEQQLAAIKSEAARAASETAQSVNDAALQAQYATDTVRQLLELQEYARDHNGDPAYYDATLQEARVRAQEASVALQAAQEAKRLSDPILQQINGATQAGLEDARTKLQQMQTHARVARESQQRAARSAEALRRVIESNQAIDNALHDRQQQQRLESVTTAIDGGNNGLLSNLTRGRGAPGGQSFLGQMFNAAGNALSGVRDWWTRDVARAASRSEGGKMMYQAANIGLGLIGTLMGIGLYSTLGNWTGLKINGGVKLLVVGAVLLYLFRGTSAVGDRLDRMAGRYTATSGDYNLGSGSVGASPFGSSVAPVRRIDGSMGERPYPGMDIQGRTFGHNDQDRMFREFADGPRTDACVVQGACSASPDEAADAYGRARTISHSDDTIRDTSVVDFSRRDHGAELALAH